MSNRKPFDGWTITGILPRGFDTGDSLGIKEFPHRIGFQLKPHQENMLTIYIQDEKRWKMAIENKPAINEPGDPVLNMIDALGNRLARLCKNQSLLSARARVETEIDAATGCGSVIEVEVNNK